MVPGLELETDEAAIFSQRRADQSTVGCPIFRRIAALFCRLDLPARGWANRRCLAAAGDESIQAGSDSAWGLRRQYAAWLGRIGIFPPERSTRHRPVCPTIGGDPMKTSSRDRRVGARRWFIVWPKNCLAA